MKPSSRALKLVGRLQKCGAIILLCAMTSGAGARSVTSDDSSLVIKGAPVEIPNSRQMAFISKLNGHRYLIKLSIPYAAPPPHGYKVLYVLDGNWYFSSATEVAQNFSDVVVVGIGYPEDANFVQQVDRLRGPASSAFASMRPVDQAVMRERVYDLTLPAPDDVMAMEAFPGTIPPKAKNVGGVDDFLKIIETEVKPRVAATVAIDPKESALFGDSLGGLAALHALLVEPNAFQTFIIGSPSIWWNRKEVLKDLPKFREVVSAGQAKPKVMVTIGSEEETAPKILPPAWGRGLSRSVVQKSYDYTRMVRNGADIVAELKNIHGAIGYTVSNYVVFANNDHGFSLWPALALGTRFAFYQWP